MNDKGKGKVTAAASSSSSTAFNVFAPVFALSKKFEMLSESKGKSKQPDEPLPGSFLFFSSCISLTGFPPLQNIPNPTRTQYVASASSRFRPRILPFRLPCPRTLLPSCNLVYASHVQTNILTASHAWPSISRGSSTPAEPET